MTAVRLLTFMGDGWSFLILLNANSRLTVSIALAFSLSAGLAVSRGAAGGGLCGGGVNCEGFGEDVGG